MKNSKDKRFLKLPVYPGGNMAFREFITKNLRYPEAALTNKIHGIVHIEYEVNDNGRVSNALVTSGLGYGCDEEALRLVSLLRYEKVKNRGLRVSSKIKTRIEFQLPKEIVPSINMNYKPKEINTSPSSSSKEPYHYSIKLN